MSKSAARKRRKMARLVARLSKLHTQRMASSRAKPRGQKQKDKFSSFYRSVEWARLAYEAKRGARRCLLCGAGPETGAVLHADHVKPIRKYWDLRLEKNNIQVLCHNCNRGKGSWDQTYFREPSEVLETYDDPLYLEYRQIFGSPAAFLIADGAAEATGGRCQP